MHANREIILFHAPQSRSLGVLALLEELGANYRLQVLNLKAGEQRKPEYRAINPMGKVPAVKHGDAIITEQVAIYAYLADLHPEAGLTPIIGDSLRGPFLRWLAFYGSCFEPAVVDRMMQHELPPFSTSPYGDYDTMLNALTGQLSQGPFLLGEECTAADILWGTALEWTMMFKLVPELPVITAYVEQIKQRPGVRRAKAKDAELAAAQETAH